MAYCNSISVFLLFVLHLHMIKCGRVSESGHNQGASENHVHPHRRKSANIATRHRRYEGIVFPTNQPRYVNCYSCMSKRLESNWEFIWQMYRRPEQFSETCDPENFKRGLVKLRNCSDFCIWITAETQVFGQKIPIYTRGCMSDVINYRQDDVRIRKLRRKEECVKLHLTEIFNDGAHKVPNNERIELCACHSNYCNGAPSGTSNASRRSHFLACLLFILMVSGFWRCIY